MIKRHKSKKPHIIVNDDDYHWYLIPHNQIDNFEQWQEDIGEDRESKFDFYKNQVDSPKKIWIFEWEEE